MSGAPGSRTGPCEYRNAYQRLIRGSGTTRRQCRTRARRQCGETNGDRYRTGHRDGFLDRTCARFRAPGWATAIAPSAWENSLWTAPRLLNDFFELRFSTFVINPTL